MNHRVLSERDQRENYSQSTRHQSHMFWSRVTYIRVRRSNDAITWALINIRILNCSKDCFFIRFVCNNLLELTYYNILIKGNKFYLFILYNLLCGKWQIKSEVVLLAVLAPTSLITIPSSRSAIPSTASISTLRWETVTVTILALGIYVYI